MRQRAINQLILASAAIAVGPQAFALDTTLDTEQAKIHIETVADGLDHLGGSPSFRTAARW